MFKRNCTFALRVNVLAIILAGVTLLSGCSRDGFNFSVMSTVTVVDYSHVSCQEIWTLHQRDSDAEDHPEYWLQMMLCAKSLDSLQANEKLADNIGDEWQVQFRRGILLNQIKSTEGERRQIAEQIVRQCSSTVPLPVCSLAVFWSDSQGYLYSLATERSRYQRLKDNSESQIKELNQRLDILQMKLKSLADIESQLSARKIAPGENTEEPVDENATDAQLTNTAEQKPADEDQATIVPSEDKPQDPQVSK